MASPPLNPPNWLNKLVLGLSDSLDRRCMFTHDPPAATQVPF